MADNANHYFWYDLTDSMRRAANDVRHEDLDPTVIDTFVEDFWDMTTDVITWQEPYNGRYWCGLPWSQYYGFAWCFSLNTANECEQHNVAFNTDNTQGRSDYEKEQIVCHEFGHSLGFGHHDGNTCMDNSAGSYVWTFYDDHDRVALRTWY